jgi:hypothetical protein
LTVTSKVPGWTVNVRPLRVPIVPLMRGTATQPRPRYEIVTPVRSQAAWAMVTGTLRIVTSAPGCPHADRNADGIVDPELAGELLQAVIATAASIRPAIPGRAVPVRPGSLVMMI